MQVRYRDELDPAALVAAVESTHLGGARVSLAAAVIAGFDQTVGEMAAAMNLSPRAVS